MTASNLAIEPVRGSSLSSLDDIPHSMEFNLFKTLDGLVNGWCERRALRPLAYFKPNVAAESAEQLAGIDKRIEEHGRSTRAD
jgi:hypothetical protein